MRINRKTSSVTAIATALVMTLCIMAFGGQEAFAEDHDIGSIEDPKPVHIEEREYMPNAALVMFNSKNNSTGKSNRNRIQSLLRSSVSDIQIQKLWMFSTQDQLTAGSGGTRKLVKDGSSTGYNGVALVRSNSMTTEQLVRLLGSRKDVKYAEPNYKVYARGVSDDTYSDLQWSMLEGENTPNVTHEWNAKGTSGSDNIVAILDTGVDYKHPDLQDNMWENSHYPKLKGECGYDFINSDADPMDDNGHGSHCAGIMGAVGDNGIGISGVNKSVRIMAFKTLDANGFGYLSNEVEAYNYIDIALDLKEPVKAINNSWGGGEESRIFAELIDIVGEKGAVTVCAAGNASLNNDVYADYPSNIDSPYLVSVAATDRDGQLAEYSNYGEEKVHVAAPGTSILSTVPFNCYNPTIYSDQKQSEVSESYNDFTDPANKWAVPVIDSEPGIGTVYLDGELYDPETSHVDISISDSDEGFENEGSMVIDVDGAKEGDLICFTIPYEIDENAVTAPEFSTMVRTSSPNEMDMGALFAITDTQADKGKNVNELNSYDLTGTYVDSPSRLWRHLKLELPDKNDCMELIKKARKKGQPELLQREVVMLLYAYEDGDYRIQLDDMGLSRQDIRSSVFEKYEYMSGTSMATPYITGSIALKAAELGEDAEVDTVINETISMSKDSPKLPVKQAGSFDFRKRPQELPPRIGKVTANISGNTVTINGSGLDPSGEVKVEVGNDEDSLQEVAVSEKSDNRLIIGGRGLINNVRTIKVTGFNGCETLRKDVYIVKGKKNYTKVDTEAEAIPLSMTTDGKRAYFTSGEGFISYVGKSGSNYYVDDYCMVTPKSIFKGKTRETADYSMAFGKDLVYSNGSLYTAVEYGPSNVSASIEDDFEFALSNGAADNGFRFREKTVSGSASSIYSGEIRLIGTFKDSDGEIDIRNYGSLPADINSTADWTMTAYNGKLYFIGGYSYIKGKTGFSKTVKIFDPATKKWSTGASLPEGRAGGKAIQVGDKIVYTLGYSEAMKGQDVTEQKYPVNLIFDGRKWTKSSISDEAGLEPYVIRGTVTRHGQEYITSPGNIGLTRGGIVYMGLPVADHGDTFIYDVSKDRFSDTGYNFINRIDAEEITATSVGNVIYGFSKERLYSMPIASGQIKVTVNKPKNGTVSGGGSFMPGDTARSVVKSKTNYRIKALTLNGKKLKLTKNQRVKTVVMSNLAKDQKLTATFEKYIFRVTVKKTGSGRVYGGKKYYKGKTANIRIYASKGYRIKSVKLGKKNITVKKNATSMTLPIKNIRADHTVRVVFVKK